MLICPQDENHTKMLSSVEFLYILLLFICRWLKRLNIDIKANFDVTYFLLADNSISKWN